MIDSISPFFVVGCPRSGTSLFRDMLRVHPRLTIPPESHFIPKLYRVHGDPHSNREATRLATTILKLYWLRKWELDLDPVSLCDCRTYSEVVGRIFEYWAQRERKPRWGDKTPQYAAEIPILRTIFPNCQIIHCIRDGRDVARSFCRTSFGPANVYIAARYWRWLVEAGRSAGAKLSDDEYLEVNYEKLLCEPETTMARVWEFLGEQPVEGELRPNPIKAEPPAAGRLPKNELVTTNFGRWKEEMSLSDRVIFESIAGELLGELGYETEGCARTISLKEAIAWRAHNALRVLPRRLISRHTRRQITNAYLYNRERLKYFLRPFG